MNNFEFSPADGLMDKTSFPTNLGSETEARQQFMTLFNQLKTFMNDEIVNSLNNKNTEFEYRGSFRDFQELIHDEKFIEMFEGDGE